LVNQYQKCSDNFSLPKSIFIEPNPFQYCVSEEVSLKSPSCKGIQKFMDQKYHNAVLQAKIIAGKKSVSMIFDDIYKVFPIIIRVTYTSYLSIN